MDGDQLTGNQNSGGSGGSDGATGATGTSIMNAFTGAKQGDGKNENAGAGTVNTGDTVNSNSLDSKDTPEGVEDVQLKAWGAQLSKDIKENKDAVKALSKFNDISGLANSYLELEKKLGQGGIPDKNASDEEVQEFYKKLGKPEASEKYSFKQDEQLEKELAKIAFNANLTDAQAKAVYDFISETGNAQIKAFKESIRQQAKATDESLKKEFGNLVEDKMNSYTKGLKLFANEAVLDSLEKTGLAVNEHFVRMFIKIGEALGESKAVVNGKAGNTDGIKAINDGGTFSFFK